MTTMGPEDRTPGEGWYQDPDDPRMLRQWSGTAWRGDRRFKLNEGPPFSKTPPARPSVSPVAPTGGVLAPIVRTHERAWKNRRRVGAIAVGVVVALFVVWLAVDNFSTDDTTHGDGYAVSGCVEVRDALRRTVRRGTHGENLFTIEAMRGPVGLADQSLSQSSDHVLAKLSTRLMSDFAVHDGPGATRDINTLERACLQDGVPWARTAGHF